MMQRLGKQKPGMFSTALETAARKGFRSCFAWALVALGLFVPCGNDTAAQETWDYSPYRIRAWISFSGSPALSPLVFENVAASVRQQAQLVAGSAWELQVEPAPEAVRHDILQRLDELAVEDIQRADETGALEGDKMFLVAVASDGIGFDLRVREFCCRSRTWGPVVDHRVLQKRLLADTVFLACSEAFAPLVRIEATKGDEAQVRLRAGGLIVDPLNPAALAEKAILQPVMRRNDRYGEAASTQIVPWTFLQVRQRIGTRAVCRVYSGLRNPIGGRNSARLERYALAVRPRTSETQLTLQTAGENAQPLAGYDVYAKEPAVEQAEREDPEKKAADQVELIGRSDWRGIVSVPAIAQPLRILYVKNGNQLLARLPMVPGLEPRQTAELSNDDVRLQAEAFVAGLRSRLMDLVAQRQILASQIRRRIADGKADEARELFDQFRALEPAAELDRVLNQQQQRLSSPNPRVQRKIDQLFGDTRKLLNKYLDNELANQLTSELAKLPR